MLTGLTSEKPYRSMPVGTPLNEEQMMTSSGFGRRAFLSGTAATTIAVTAAACGGGSGGGSADTLEIWLPAPQGVGTTQEEHDFYVDMVQPFADEHGVTLNFTMIPWGSYEEKYLTGISSGSGPHLGYMYAEMLGNYAQQGALAPLDDIVPAEALDRMKYLPEGQLDGVQYSLPYVVGNPRLIWVNMELLEEAGIDALPSTWDEFIDAAGQVAEKTGKHGTLMPWGDDARGMMNSCYFPYLWQAGGSLFTEDGSATAFNSDAGLEAAQFLMDLLETKAMPSMVTGMNGDEVEASFLAGECAFTTAGTTLLPQFEKEGIDAQFIDSLTNQTKATFVANDALVVTEAAPDKELAGKLLAFLTSGENMAKFHEEISQFPPIAEDEELDPDDPFAEVYTQTDMLRGLPIVANGNAVYNTLYQNLQQMVLGQKTPEQALQDAADEGDSALGTGS